jgi:hypothetical protein
MDMAVVMDGAIAADAGIITGGAEVVATTMVGGIIAITGDLTSISSERPLSWRPLSCRVAQAMSPIDAVDGSSTGTRSGRCLLLADTVSGMMQTSHVVTTLTSILTRNGYPTSTPLVQYTYVHGLFL